MSTDDIKQAFRSSGLSPQDVDQYFALLQRHGYNTERLMQNLTIESLLELGIDKIGHARAILNSIAKLQRTRVQKRHVFYISHDKRDAGSEASMFADAAALRFADKPAFIDADHRYFRSLENFREALLASNFCLVLLTPRYFLNAHCLSELVWAYQSDTPICVVEIDRIGLEPVDKTIAERPLISFLPEPELLKLGKWNIDFEDVQSALQRTLQPVGRPLVFQPHESREMRMAFFSTLWRYLGEMAASEAGTQIYAIDQRVDVRWRKGERWYTGRVSFIAPNGTYDILYDDGDRESGVTPDFMKHHQRPPIVIFRPDDRVEAKWKRRNTYFSGRIVAVHEDVNEYDILYDDGDIEYNVSYELIRRFREEDQA